MQPKNTFTASNNAKPRWVTVLVGFCAVLLTVGCSCIIGLYWIGSSLSLEERTALHDRATARAMTSYARETSQANTVESHRPQNTTAIVNGHQTTHTAVSDLVVPPLTQVTSTPPQVTPTISPSLTAIVPTATSMPTLSPSLTPSQTMVPEEATALAVLQVTTTAQARLAAYLEQEQCRGDRQRESRECVPPASARLTIESDVGWTHVPTKPWARRRLITHLRYDNEKYYYQSSVGPLYTARYRVRNLLVRGQYRELSEVGVEGEWVIYEQQSEYLDAIGIIFEFPNDGLPLSERAICVEITDWLGRIASETGEQCNLERRFAASET